MVLVPGPEEERAIVRRIYQPVHAASEDARRRSPTSSTRQGTQPSLGRPWTRGTVHQVLTNEKYIGNNVYQPHLVQAEEEARGEPARKVDSWAMACLKALSKPAFSHTAQGIILARSRKLRDDEMLEKLRGVLNKHGRICGMLIDEADGLPSSAAFSHRFGSLVSAYRLIGYEPGIDYSFIEINRKLRMEHPKIVASVIQQIGNLGDRRRMGRRKRTCFHLNNELRVSIVLCRHWSQTAVHRGGS